MGDIRTEGNGSEMRDDVNYVKYLFVLAELCAGAVQDKHISPEIINGIDYKVLYKLACRHLLTGVTAYALESAGIKDEAFTQAKGKAVRKVTVMDIEREAVFCEFEREGIWYVPLKGCVLKDAYPDVGMRQMADNDILIDSEKAEEARRIMEKLGFETIVYDKGVHDTYHKEPVCNFELHRRLFSPSFDQKIADYYDNVKDMLIKDGDANFGFHFSHEDFYIYVTAHEYKHESGNGTGLRSLLDEYVFIKRYEKSLNWDYINRELNKLGLADFERSRKKLALHLFGEGKLSDDEMLILQTKVLRSAVYGTKENGVKNRVQGFGGGCKGKRRYFFYRLFIPRSNLKYAYPRVYRYPILLPFFWIWRIIKALVTGSGRILGELRILRKI